MNDEKMKPTVEWMSRKYDEMNQLLFNGELGGCQFKVFTSGRGSNGGTLGWFGFEDSENLRVRRADKRLFRENWLGEKIFADRSNFVELCRPVIELNGNYKWTEKAMLSTLVHEMCHYYTAMRGCIPTQWHGKEFKFIAAVVSSKSNDFFTVERLARAEEMEEMELDAEIVKKNKEKEERKKSRINVVIVHMRNGETRLTTTSNPNVIKEIVEFASYSKGAMQIVKKTNDPDIVGFLFNKGFKKDFRTWRYWGLGNSVVNELNQFGDDKWKILYSAEGVTMPKSQPQEKTRKFRLKTSSGEIVMTFENDDDLFSQIKARFPNMKDEVIRKLMANESNYIMENTRIKTNMIIENVIKKYINKKKRELFYW